MVERFAGRSANQLRPFFVTYNVIEYTSGSVLFTIGRTKVICAISLQNGVPHFLKGKKQGWLQAEYSMLPAATHVRKERETIGCKRNARSVEISRFIGRALRSIIDFSLLGERTIIVDCDVIQADGGTRAAALCGAFIALSIAVKKWLTDRVITHSLLKDSLGAISVGIMGDEILLDIDCAEDMRIDADFTYVITGSGKIIEVQGTAEKNPIEWHQMQLMYQLAHQAIQKIINHSSLPQSSTDQFSKKIFNAINFSP